MKAKRRKEFTMETHEITIIRFKSKKPAYFCEDCGTYTFYLTISESVSLLAISETEILRWLDEKSIHSRESEGFVLLCSNSLTTLSHK